MRYLTFQVFTGGEPTRALDGSPLEYTPPNRVAAMVDSIIAGVNRRGGNDTRLGFVIGPLGFDHSDSEVQQMIGEAGEIALSRNVAWGVHLDTDMFWSRRAPYFMSSVEHVDWSGTPATSLLLDWVRPRSLPPRFCFNEPAVERQAVAFAEVVGRSVRDWLRRTGRLDLFAGVLVGWETHLGIDAATRSPAMFRALRNRGCSPSNPPTPDVLDGIVRRYLQTWTSALTSVGVPVARIYSHVAFMTREQYQTSGATETYEEAVNTRPSSTNPANALGSCYPGFSTYPTPGLHDQVAALVGTGPWASCEGAPRSPSGEEIPMRDYLAQTFGRGAQLVNLFSWGVDSPMRASVEGPEAILAYTQFFDGGIA